MGGMSMWITEKSFISIHYLQLHAAGGKDILLLPQQQPLLLVGNKTAGEFVVYDDLKWIHRCGAVVTQRKGANILNLPVGEPFNSWITN